MWKDAQYHLSSGKWKSKPQWDITCQNGYYKKQQQQQQIIDGGE